jgi:hypothetical protein
MMRFSEGFGGLDTDPLIISDTEEPRAISLYPSLIKRNDETAHHARQTEKIRAYCNYSFTSPPIWNFLKNFFLNRLCSV